MRLYIGKIPLEDDLTFYKTIYKGPPLLGKTFLTEEVLDVDKTLHAHREHAKTLGLISEGEVLKMNGKFISGKVHYYIEVFKEKIL